MRPDASGRRRPIPVEGSDFVLDLNLRYRGDRHQPRTR